MSKLNRLLLHILNSLNAALAEKQKSNDNAAESYKK